MSVATIAQSRRTQADPGVIRGVTDSPGQPAYLTVALWTPGVYWQTFWTSAEREAIPADERPADAVYIARIDAWTGIALDVPFPGWHEDFDREGRTS